MERYKDLTGMSGVLRFEEGTDYLIVEFVGRERYLYDAHKPGAHALTEMKRLARQGKGLATYISQKVRLNYAKKLS